MPASAGCRIAAWLALLGLAACNGDTGVGYVEIKTAAVSTAPALYLDTVKLEPMRNGMAVLRQKVGTTKLQIDGEGGQLALLCNIVVQKNRITTVTVSAEQPPAALPMRSQQHGRRHAAQPDLRGVAGHFAQRPSMSPLCVGRSVTSRFVPIDRRPGDERCIAPGEGAS